jgi:hypothetical protein
MWVYFDLLGYHCEAKVFKNPGMFGIREGRVSKLYVTDSKGKQVWVYERGGDEDKAPPGLIDALMKKYPEVVPPLSDEERKKLQDSSDSGMGGPGTTCYRCTFDRTPCQACDGKGTQKIERKGIGAYDLEMCPACLGRGYNDTNFRDFETEVYK